VIFCRSCLLEKSWKFMEIPGAEHGSLFFTPTLKHKG
jgi:hypothetical protein